jgi:hypothetical protein
MTRIWEKIELRFEAAGRYANPYTDVLVWVDLEGPGFHQRVYGFWDGGSTWQVRLLAPAPGTWSWISGSSPHDAGLAGISGRFVAEPWSEAEMEENPTRRGFIRPTNNGHALELADGTPFLLVGDTWWSTPTWRYPWYDDDAPRALGPGMGFKDMVAWRKAQGYNCIAILAALPTWASDGRPAFLRADDPERTAVRDAWATPGTSTAKDMHNEGGRPFLFPGKVPGFEDVVPDYDRLNPDYFRFLDRKIDHLNAQGFFPFIEAARRDVSPAWRRWYDWPRSYARYVHYLFSRYQANNCILSPIHFDYSGSSIPSREYNAPANLVIEEYGAPPFGTLLSANPSPSTLMNFGGPGDAPWLTLHQIGNWREHDHYWYLTDIFHSSPARPAINGEPYYPGFPDDDPPADSREAERNCRSALYGSFLSGGLGGFIYGVDGLWGGDVEPEARHRTWEALQFRSGAQVPHLRAFATLEGPRRYEDLVPARDAITPNTSGPALGYRGWAFAARTAARDWFLCYLEVGAAPAVIRGAIPGQEYDLLLFNPTNGRWTRHAQHPTLTADRTGRIPLPALNRRRDWGISLKAPRP